MKTTRLITIGISVIFMLAACQAQPPAATPDPGLVETQVASTVAAQAAKMTAEYEQLLAQATATPPPTNTPEPSPTASATTEPSPTPLPTSAVVFRDDFEDKLADGWIWVRENKQRWDLGANPGFLRITLNPAANCGGGIRRNVPLQPVPKGNYEISTYMEFTPINNFQFAGLIVYQDDRNNVELGRAYCDTHEICVGNGIYFDNVVGGAGTGGNYSTSTANPSNIYLRLQRIDNTFTGFFSEDGQNWIKIGQHTNNLQPVGVGLFAGQSCQGSVPADFDYFEIIQLP